jgi:hypothetical protein
MEIQSKRSDYIGSTFCDLMSTNGQWIPASSCNTLFSGRIQRGKESDRGRR